VIISLNDGEINHDRIDLLLSSLMTQYELQTFSVDGTYGRFGIMYYLQRRAKISYFIMTATLQKD
jgi:hypothetical protein